MQTSIKLVNIGIKCAIRHGSTSEVPVGGVGCPFGRNKTTKKKKKLGGGWNHPRRRGGDPPQTKKMAPAENGQFF